jgi:hypothetical protein
VVAALEVWRLAEAWDPAGHPRIPKGQPGAGRFLSTSAAPTGKQVTEHIERILGPTIPEPMRSLLAGELEVQARFAPHLVLTLRGVDMPARLPPGSWHLRTAFAYYQPDTEDIVFNPRKWRRSWAPTMRPAAGDEFSLTSRRTEIESTMAHEFGHHVVEAVLRQASRDDQIRLAETFDENLAAGGSLAGLVRSGASFDAAVDSWLERSGGRSAAERVSAYGASNYHELMAEVWHEYTTAHVPRPEVSAMGLAMERLASRSGGSGS